MSNCPECRRKFKNGFDSGILRAANIARSWGAEENQINAILVEWMRNDKTMTEAKEALALAGREGKDA